MVLREPRDPPRDRREKLRYLEVAQLRIRHETEAAGCVVDEHGLHNERVEVTFRLSADPKRWIAVTAPPRAPRNPRRSARRRC
jgi:hypothetical protein